MRAVSFTIYNGQIVELVVSRREGDSYQGFEVWLIGTVKGHRTILDHFLTTQLLERLLSYAQAGDLVWQDVDKSILPRKKSPVAVEAEALVAKGKFQDRERVVYHFNGTLSLPVDRKAGNAAKKALLGRWTDGIATLTFEPEQKLTIACPAAEAHPLFMAAHVNRANWWNFSPWMLFLMNDAEKRGERLGVWRCDGRELHIVSRERDRLAHIFRRV